jgi:hypothetical protein
MKSNQKLHNIIQISDKDLLIKVGYSYKDLRCLPPWVLKAMVKHHYTNLIDEDELRLCLNQGGFEIE